ncbi:CRISPR-associated protein Cas4 [Halorubrum gandharaense]
MQCHRKLVYRKENAPAETEMAHGILWVGTRFEEDVVLPFLRDAVDDKGLLVTNSLYVDFEVETDAGELVVKGSTDPVVVDGDGAPVLPTEVKTKGSLEYLNEPNEHHKAQLHAYMVGLSEKYDVDVKRGCLIYGERDSFDLEVFDIEFDDAFWRETVLEWATEHTEYRLAGELPPANSRFSWECDFCAYRERCGKGDKPVADRSFEGFLPNMTYPRPLVTEHLAAHPDAVLTPTLAAAYPDLAKDHAIAQWRCTACSEQFNHHEVDWGKDSDGTPLCPSCVHEDTLSELTVSWPPEHESVSNGVGSA